MSFKIIALRPLAECDTKYSKVLKRDTFYQLHNAYRFDSYVDESNEVIGYAPEQDIDLYSSEGIDISINAVVGKNGSGKSTLTELFYAFIFCLSLERQVGFLTNIKVKQEHEFTPEESKRYDLDVQKMSGLKMEIYYAIDDIVFRIRKDNGFKIDEFIFKDGFYIKSDVNHILNKKFTAEKFFYSIAVNYSLYGLNTNETGLWLKPLFHKNDAYQTPLVLNPMRTEGIIEINKVTYLSKSRLLSNILQPIPEGTDAKDSLRNLVSGKIAHEIQMEIDYRKFNLIKRGKNLGKIRFDYYTKYSKKVLYKILNTFRNLEAEKMTQDQVNAKYRSPRLLDKIAIEYIIRKIEKIAKTYHIDRRLYGDKFDLGEETLVTALLDDLETEYSHITFKLRQAVNFLRYDLATIDKKQLSHKPDTEKLSQQTHELIEKLVELDAEEQREKLAEKKKKDGISRVIPEGTDFTLPKAGLQLINFLPPSFFELDIIFEDLGTFGELSSGERQKVYSLNSIVYHLVNLKSVDGTSNVRYNYINLIFDEVELYFHPEFQRIFINDLIVTIKRSNCIFSGINVTFITHSPFILSDIPNNNILYLDIPENAKLAEPKINTEQTFAANIHELLSNGFFMRYAKGDFALQKITEIVDFYERVRECNDKGLEGLKTEFKEKLHAFEQLCSIIGERYIQDILKNNLSYMQERFGIYSDNTIEQKIQDLNSQIDNLKKMQGKP